MKLLLLTIVTLFSLNVGCLAFAEELRVSQGKISPWEAIDLAKKKISGRPIQANYEFDDGKWIYGVLILTKSGIREVDVDPLTGEVGDIESLTPEEESHEVFEELSKVLKQD